MARFLGLGRRGRHERAGFSLYGAAVAAARDPWLYEGLGVPDTLDGRFDLVGLHDVARKGAPDMIAQALEEEVREYLGRHADERDHEDHRMVVLNGHEPPRNIMTGVGNWGNQSGCDIFQAFFGHKFSFQS